MRKLLIILILLLLPVSGWGATYYVRTDGSNTSPYDTEAKGATVIKTVVDYIRTNGAGAGDTIDIGPGTFNATNDYFYLDHANLDNLTIQGAGRTLTLITQGSGTQHTLYGSDNLSALTVNDVTLISVAAAKNPVYKTADAGTWTFNRCDFTLGTGGGDDILDLRGDTTNLSYCRFQMLATTNKYCINATGDSGGTIKFCMAYPTGGSAFAGYGGFLLSGSGTTNVYNSVLIGIGYHGIWGQNGTVNIKNNIIQAGMDSHVAYSVYKSSGTLNALNNLLISSPFVNERWCNALDTDTNNIKTNANPKFISYARRGYIVPMVDDTGNLDYAEMVAGLLAARGWKGTWCPTVADITGGIYSDVRTLLQGGTMEIGLHGYSHTSLIYAHALNFSQAGGANCTVAFDGSTITCDCDDTDYDQTLDTTNASYDTVGEIVTALNGSKGWTVAKSTTDSQTASYISDSALATSFASMGATAEPCDIDFDRTGIESGLLKDEMADAKTLLENTVVNGAGNITDPQTGNTYQVNSFGATYYLGDATTKAAAYVTFQNYRYSATGAAIEDTVQRLTDVDAYALGALNPVDHIKGDGSEADIRQNIRALAFAVAQCGMIVPILTHTTDSLTEAQWGYVLDELSKFPNIDVTSMQLAIADIKANWTDDEDGTYSKTYTTFTDPLLQATSPCINAGTNPFSDGDGDQYDYAGNLVWSDTTDAAVGAWSDGVEIGAYGWFGGILLH